MRHIIELELKKLISNRASIFYIIGYCLICGIFVPYFTNEHFNTLIIILIFSSITQFSPAVFAKEKEEKTFETLISIPKSMKKIFISKAIYCFIIIVTILYISYALNCGISYFIFNNFDTKKYLSIKNIIVYLLMLPLSILNLSYHATYISLKSNDSRACAIKTIYICIPYYIISTFLIEIANKPKQIFILGLVFYIFVNITIFMVINFIIKKYFHKSKLLQLLNN